VIELRRATTTDAAEIAELFLASFKATYEFPLAHTDAQVQVWIAEVLLPTDEVWVASSAEGSIVGMMALSDEMLDELYLAPAWTGRGIGSQLVELAKRRRPAGLDLFTFQVNANARAFYERRGFVEVWLGDGSANEEGQPDVRYEWRRSRDEDGSLCREFHAQDDCVVPAKALPPDAAIDLDRENSAGRLEEIEAEGEGTNDRVLKVRLG
jgi:ribosomal protein S18 acetylase RimI-like enzyme